MALLVIDIMQLKTKKLQNVYIA